MQVISQTSGFSNGLAVTGRAQRMLWAFTIGLTAFRGGVRVAAALPMLVRAAAMACFAYGGHLCKKGSSSLALFQRRGDPERLPWHHLITAFLSRS